MGADRFKGKIRNSFQDRIMMMLKIVGIGLHRTGTRSISKALKTFGYRSLHGGPGLNLALVNDKIDTDFFDEYDAVFDGFCCLKYQTLDSCYDNLKFIYTTRNIDSWLGSCKHRYSGYVETITRKAVFGDFTFDKKIWKDTYNRHHDRVMKFFEGREQDLLVMDIEEDNKWKKLCEFFGHKIPKGHFPWEGKRGDRE